MGQASARPGLRPYLPADAPRLAALYRDSVETLADEDYDAEQLEAWASAADDERAFAARLAASLTLVATLSGEIAGFASLKDKTTIDMLYVDPRFARRGVGSALLDALEKLAGARDAKRLTADASDAARDFFAAKGYVAQRRNTVEINGEWLGTTTMTKDLSPQGRA